MHNIALLVAENHDLRQANEILSRRRKAKRNCLQNRGKMPIEKGREPTDQMDANMQIVAESSRIGGQGSSARPRVCRCGRCGKIG
jgi:hypothetical protein